MDKKYLRSLPRIQADPSLIDLAQNEPKSKWFFKAQDHDGTIELTAFDAKALRKGETSARYRFFFSASEYITQDLSTDKTKWLTGKASSLLGFHWWGYYTEGAIRHKELVFADGKSRQTMEDRFSDRRKGETVWDRLHHWQEDVLEEKLDARHERELQHTGEMMELVPELPQDFNDWIDGYAMYDKRFLIYDANPKEKMRRAYCTHCGRQMLLNPKKIRLRMNEKGICPECESAVTMRPFGKLPRHELHNKFVALIQRIGDDQILIRYFYVSYNFTKDDLLFTVRKERYASECCREFLTGIGNRLKKESFEFAVYKQKGNLRWCPDTDSINCGMAVLYTKGLRETLAGTEYQYSGLEKFQEYEGCNPIPLWKYLDTYPGTKELETLVKAGLTTLASDIVSDPFIWRNAGFHKRGIPEGLSKLTKEHRRILRDINGGESVIGVLREFELCRSESNADAIKDFIETFGSNTKLVRDLTLLGIKISKFTRYTQKQMTAQRKKMAPWKPISSPAYGLLNGPRDARQRNVEQTKNFVHDWSDYIGWSRDLGYNLKDEYVLMPPDFCKAHDRLMEEEKRKRTRY